MDAATFYYSQTGVELFGQFDDPSDTKVNLTEGSGEKIYRYAVSVADLIEAELPEGNWNMAIKVGTAEDSDGTEIPLEVIPVDWTGTDLVSADFVLESGGGIISARIGTVSLTSSDFLEIVQGEEKVITFIVEAHSQFVTDSFESISVKFKDTDGTVIEKIEDGAIQRVCEELDIQVFRVTLDAEDTDMLSDGTVLIEIALDTTKAHLSHSMKVIEKIESDDAS